jgi:hypothetical protein
MKLVNIVSRFARKGLDDGFGCLDFGAVVRWFAEFENKTIYFKR